jgi:hypothetical protein
MIEYIRGHTGGKKVLIMLILVKKLLTALK